MNEMNKSTLRRRAFQSPGLLLGLGVLSLWSGDVQAQEVVTGTLTTPLRYTPGETLSDIRRRAKDASTDLAALGFGTQEVRTAQFEGTFTPAIKCRLAVHSDDGFRVYVNNTLEMDRYEAGQDLSNLGQSFHLLDMVFEANTTYSVGVEYQNKFHTGDGDVDGITVYAYGDTDSKGRVVISSDLDSSFFKEDDPNPISIDAMPNTEMNIRNENGYLEADSVAVWASRPSPAQQKMEDFWMGQATYSAETTAFEFPSYKWTLNSDDHPFDPSVGLQPLPNLEFSGQQKEFSFNLGTTPIISAESGLKSTLGKSTTVIAKATDAEGVDLRELANSYTVRWHYPVENWTKAWTAWKPTGNIYADWSQPATPNVSLTISLPDTIVTSTGANEFGQFLVAGVTGGVATQFASSNPLLAAAISAGGWVLSETLPEQPVSNNHPTTYAHYVYAVERQKWKRTTLATSNNQALLNEAAQERNRIMAPDPALDAMYNEVQRVKLNHGSDSTKDKYYMNQTHLIEGGVTVRAQAFLGQQKMLMHGDSYDRHGFNGQESALVHGPDGTPQYFYEYTFEPTGN